MNMAPHLAVAVILTMVPLFAGEPEKDVPHIEWDAKTLRLVRENGSYGRMIRLQSGEAVCSYDKEGKIWVYMTLYEQEFFLVYPGQKISVETPLLPDKKFDGVVRAVSETPDPLTRTVLVRALIDNPEALLKFQMDVNVLIKIERGAALTVPNEAVFSTGERDIVFVARPEGIFEPREVRPGVLMEEGREILSGLSEGDNVVISGNFLIDSESRLKASLEGMSSMPGMDMGGEHKHGG